MKGNRSAEKARLWWPFDITVIGKVASQGGAPCPQKSSTRSARLCTVIRPPARSSAALHVRLRALARVLRHQFLKRTLYSQENKARFTSRTQLPKELGSPLQEA